MRCKLIHLGAVQQGLGGHASAVEAGAAYSVALNQSYPGSELGGAYRRDIAARASAYNEYAACLGLLCLRRGDGRVGHGFSGLADDGDLFKAFGGASFRDVYFQQRA